MAKTTGRPRGAVQPLRFCEHTVKYCPYCGSSRIQHTKERLRAGEHTIFCKRCYGVFAVPCED